MTGMIDDLVSGVLKGVMAEILKKSHGKTSTKRVKRKTRSATTGRFVKKTKPRAAKKPAAKQVSRRRTAASRSGQRSK